MNTKETDLIKDKIEFYVKEYIRLFPQEFSDFIDEMKAQRKTQLTDFAEIKNTDFMERALGEMPEVLYTMLKLRLTDEQFGWLFNAKSKEGARWFYDKKFLVFSLRNRGIN